MIITSFLLLGLALIAALVFRYLIKLYKDYDLKYHVSEVDLDDRILSPDYKLAIKVRKQLIYLSPLRYRDQLKLITMYPRIREEFEKLNSIENKDVYLQKPTEEYELLVRYCATLVALCQGQTEVFDFEKQYILLKKVTLLEIVYILNKYKELVDTDNLYIGRTSLGNFGGGNALQDTNKFDFIDALGKEYGFTLDQILDLTLPQISLYLKLIGKRNVKEYERNKALENKRNAQRRR